MLFRSFHKHAHDRDKNMRLGQSKRSSRRLGRQNIFLARNKVIKSKSQGKDDQKILRRKEILIFKGQ